MTDDVIDVEPGTDLEVRAGGNVGLFGTDDPAVMIERATAIATALDKVVTAKGLFKNIGGKRYVLVEGWTCLGNLVGVFPRTVWSQRIAGDHEGWEARVEVVTRGGEIVGGAEAECLRSEKTWANRDDYALRSMAQTRAMGKALRMPLGWIAVLAGYDATPAEEMPTSSSSTFTPPSDYADAAQGGELVADPGTCTVPFGKHKGKTIAAIFLIDKDYVGWLSESSSNNVVKAAAGAFLEIERMPF